MEGMIFKKSLFWTAVSLYRYAGFSLVMSRGYCSVAVCGLLIAVASLVAEHGF